MANAAASVTDLGALFEHYGSDKTRSGYDTIYNTLLKNQRKRITSVLEVGIGTLNPDAPSSMVGYAAPHYQPGGSLRAWRDYFPNAHIVGIDTQPDTQFTENRITTWLVDSTNLTNLYVALLEQSFDLIIDDGDHHPTSQLITLNNLWPRVKPGGAYIIEDITSEAQIQRLTLAVAGLAGNPKPTANVNAARNFMVIACVT